MEEIETVEPIKKEIQPDPYEETFTQDSIIKFCCICGVEFSVSGKTNEYFGCQHCGTALKVMILDDQK